MNRISLLFLLYIVTACATVPTPTPAPAIISQMPELPKQTFIQEVDSYLATYSKEFQRLSYESSEAEWASNTHIVAGDSTNSIRTRAANEAIARFVGDVQTINKVKEYLARRAELSPLQALQLERMLYLAAGSPQTAPDIVKARIAAEAAQTEKLYGYTFNMAGRGVVTPNQIDSTLRASKNLKERRAAWEASKEVGKELRPGILKLRDLRNQVVQSLGYPDFFTYQVSEYGMTTPEMMQLNEQFIKEMWPLYRELHTWARYELAKKYNEKIPDFLPADWLPNRWGQSWEDLVQVKGIDLESAFKNKTPEWIVQQGENFYVSLGFPSLPKSFYEKSSLYALPPNSPFKKNTHASAWHMDLENDVRSLMSVEPNADWYSTVHHELGHIYYYMFYTNPNVPVLLRNGANRAYHEGMGTMMELASSQPRFLAARGLIPTVTKTDSIGQLLREALNYIVFIPWSSGVMTHFERDLYTNNLPADSLNARWWEYVKKYQGIVPPTPRGEEYADATTKTHINDDAAQYYDYAISNALLFQLHNHIARNILKQDPHNTDYYGNKEVGNFLRNIMTPGASRPWRDVLRETTGQELNTQAMVEYFAPLYEWLKAQNKGRKYTL